MPRMTILSMDGVREVSISFHYLCICRGYPRLFVSPCQLQASQRVQAHVSAWRWTELYVPILSFIALGGPKTGAQYEKAWRWKVSASHEVIFDNLYLMCSPFCCLKEAESADLGRGLSSFDKLVTSCMKLLQESFWIAGKWLVSNALNVSVSVEVMPIAIMLQGRQESGVSVSPLACAAGSHPAELRSTLADVVGELPRVWSGRWR